MLRTVGLTSDGVRKSMKHAVFITAAGIVLLSVIGYSTSFKAFMPDYSWVAFYLLISVPVQEIFFRGFVQTRLYRFGRARAIIAASILYSMIHFNNPILVLLALVAGLVWGYSFSKYRTLSGPVFSHSVLGLYLFLLVM
ncbi:MAG: CPBP family intramembrane metalloprotease [Candidatus Aenigmarchaeota archaeon]|nr:CPBP family intramembrane metalloprotease [Candidatus Aenigmarchaeota archaeon]